MFLSAENQHKLKLFFQLQAEKPAMKNYSIVDPTINYSRI